MTKSKRARYTIEFKLEAVRMVKGGQSLAVVSKVLDISDQTLHNWVKLDRNGQLNGAGSKPVSPEQMETARLRAELARVKMERDILGKSDGVLRKGAGVKYAWIKRHRTVWPVSLTCEVLRVSASGYHEHERREGRASSGRVSDDALLVQIKAIHAEVRGEYGRPRVWKELLARGIRVGKDRVQKLMQQHGIKARGKRKFIATTDSNHGMPVAENLLNREFQPTTPNGVWTSDITYIATVTRAGCTWPSSSTCSAGRSWAGRCSRICVASW